MRANEALISSRNGDLNILKSFSLSEVGRIRDKYGASCLHYAARGDNVSVLEYLIENKSLDILTRSNVGATAVHDAAASGNLEALKWFITNTTFNVNNQDGTGACVVHLAARYGHVTVLQWLINNTDCDVLHKSATGSLPLHFAVVSGDVSCVKLLLDEAPRTINSQLNNGVTAAYLACQEGHLEVLECLVTKGGANIKMNSYDGMTCLHAAGQLGHLNCLQWLIDSQKLNPNERDFDGATALHFAATGGYHQVIEWLMKKGGAKITLDNLGGSPLHNAVQMGHSKCVQVLIDNGCNIDITDNNGLSALELAITCQETECAAVLKGELVLNTQETEEQRLESSTVKPVDLPPSAELKSIPSTPTSKDIIPPHRRSELFRPVSILSAVSTSSDFGSPDPRPSGKQHQVLAEVHCKNSKETGEKECPHKIKNSLVLNSTYSSTNNQPHHPALNSVHFHAQSNNSINSNKIVPVLSSIDNILQTSIKSSPSSNSDKRDSNNNQGLVQKRNSFRSSRSFSQGSCEESGETILIYDDTMDNADDIVQNGVDEHGLKKSVIQIRNTDSQTNHNGSSYNSHQTNQSEFRDSNIARISIKGENEPDARASPPLPPPPTPPESTQSSPVKTAAFPPPPPPPSMEQSTSALNGDYTSSKSTQSVLQTNSIQHNIRPAAMSIHQSTAPRPDIATEILRSGGSSSLKKSKPPTPGGGMNCVFSFGSDSKSSKSDTTANNNKKSLTGEYDPKNFLDQVPMTDSSGLPIPEWRRLVLAKNAAQKAMTDDAENNKVAAMEARFANMPSWKREMIEKKEKEKRDKEEELINKIKSQKVEYGPQLDEDGNLLTPWQVELISKKNGFKQY